MGMTGESGGPGLRDALLLKRTGPMTERDLGISGAGSFFFAFPLKCTLSKIVKFSIVHFSAVWTATIARVGSFFSIFRDLQDLHSFKDQGSRIKDQGSGGRLKNALDSENDVPSAPTP